MDRPLSALKLRQLQYFIAVADTLHFTKAADSLAVTQPTLSHQIAELETTLGAVLFDRAGKSVRLTQAGELFRAFAIRSIKQLEAGCVALSELEGLLRGNLRIGVIQSFSHTLLPPILGAFVTSHPGIKVDIEEMTAGGIERALAAGIIDLGIAFASAAHEATELEPVLQEELLLVVRHTHPLAKRTRVKMADLDGVRMVLLDTSYSTRQLIDRYLATANAQPDVVCATNSMGIMLGTVMESELATIIPERALDLERLPELRAVRLREPTPVRTSALLWPRDGVRTVAARRFAELVRQRLRTQA